MDFIKAIDAFCQRHSMAESTFGRLAMRDGSFVPRIRSGRSPTMRIVYMVEKFMADYDKGAARLKGVDDESLG